MAAVTVSNTGFFMISVCLFFLYFLLDSIFIFNSKSLLHWANNFPSITDGKKYWSALGIRISLKSVTSNIKTTYSK